MLLPSCCMLRSALDAVCTLLQARCSRSCWHFASMAARSAEIGVLFTVLIEKRELWELKVLIEEVGEDEDRVESIPSLRFAASLLSASLKGTISSAIPL